MNHNSKIFVAGHNGLVGSAIIRELKKKNSIKSLQIQKKTPDDYVIATGKQFSVKQFVNLVLKELKIKFVWKGKGIS